MVEVTRYRRFLATIGLFILLAGDVFRYALSWWGWGAVVLVFLALTIVELVRARVRLHRLPIGLLVFLGFAIASIVWSNYRDATALGVTATLVATTFAAFGGLVLPWPAFVEALSLAARWVLGLSLAFELVVATVVRAPVLPFWVDYSHLDRIPPAFYWSRDLLFEGGRIQGIVGNANLLALAALIGLITFAIRGASSPMRRTGAIIWSAVAILVLALTRSSTVLAAGAAVAVVLVIVLVIRALPPRRRGPAGVLAGLVLAGGAVGVVLLREPLLGLLGKSPDLTYRFVIWNDVLALAQERLAVGWGWVSYWAPWAEPFRDLADIRGVHYYQAHNAWLDVLLQLGVVGVVLLGAFVITAAVRAVLVALEAPRERAGILDLLPLLLLVLLVVHSLAESRLLIEIGWVLLVVAAIRVAPTGAVLSPSRPVVATADSAIELAPEDGRGGGPVPR